MPKENPASDSLRECAMYLASTVSSFSLSERTVAQKNILLISPSKQRQLHIYFLITLEFQLKSAVLILHFATSLHFTLSLHVHACVCNGTSNKKPIFPGHKGESLTPSGCTLSLTCTQGQYHGR